MIQFCGRHKRHSRPMHKVVIFFDKSNLEDRQLYFSHPFIYFLAISCDGENIRQS